MTRVAGGASLKSCPARQAIDHRAHIEGYYWWTTKGWLMGGTKATHLISCWVWWSDRLIQDNLAKLEFLGSMVAPFLNLNGAHFGSLLSPERHFSSPYLGLQSPVSGEWVVDGYFSPLTLLNPSFALFSPAFSLWNWDVIGWIISCF